MLLRIYDDIQNENQAVGFFGDRLDVFSADRLRTFVDEIPADDPEIDGRIHCMGGSVIEGYACHDIITHSAKKVTMTVEGMCASISTVVLLAAKPENRRMYPNAQLFIHQPYIPEYTLADSYTAEDLAKMAKALEDETNRLVDFYALHTGADRQELIDLVMAQTTINAQEALRLGFISEILPPTANKIQSWKTTQNQLKMNQQEFEAKLGTFEALMAKIKKMLNLGTQNLQLTDSTGAVLTVERESGDPQVGDAASPDGTFVMDDGTTITVSGGVITEIQEADPMQAELENLRAENQRLQQELSAAQTAAQDLQNSIATQVQEQVSALTTELQNSLTEMRAIKSKFVTPAGVGNQQDPKPSKMQAKLKEAREKAGKQKPE